MEFLEMPIGGYNHRKCFIVHQCRTNLVRSALSVSFVSRKNLAQAL